jgi:hypothetical protein
MKRHFDEGLVRAEIAKDHETHQVGRYTVELAPGDSSWDPTTTKDKKIHGPARVTYRHYYDGGWDVAVRDTEHHYT